MKRILFLDYLSPEGHIHPTRGQIDALLDLGYDIYGVFKEGYIEKYSIQGVKPLLEIPASLYPKHPSHVKARIAETRVLIYAKRHIENKGWDHIIIPTYEPFSLSIANAFKGAYIINHNTVSYVDNPIKKLMLLSLGHRYHHIVFNEDQKRGLATVGITDVNVVPIPAHNVPENVCKDFLYTNNLEPGKFIISPSASSVNHQFLMELCSNNHFVDFLRKNDLKLIIKKNYYVPENFKDRIIPITSYLSEEEYNSLLRYSAFVLLCYPETFTFRVSGVLLECIKSKIKCLINDLPSFRAYQDYIKNDDVFYISIEELIEKGNKILNTDVKTIYKDYNYEEAIKSAWNHIFND